MNVLSFCVGVHRGLRAALILIYPAKIEPTQETLGGRSEIAVMVNGL